MFARINLHARKNILYGLVECHYFKNIFEIKHELCSFIKNLIVVFRCLIKTRIENVCKQSHVLDKCLLWRFHIEIQGVIKVFVSIRIVFSCWSCCFFIFCSYLFGFIFYIILIIVNIIIFIVWIILIFIYFFVLLFFCAALFFRLLILYDFYVFLLLFVFLCQILLLNHLIQFLIILKFLLFSFILQFLILNLILFSLIYLLLRSVCLNLQSRGVGLYI